MTDDNGAYLEEEILDYMRYGIWDMDFDADTISGLWENAKEAEAVKEVSEVYRGCAGDALKLEKALEAISSCQEKQENKKQEGLDCLEDYNGPLFRTKAQAVIQQLSRIPGLVENYQDQADLLSEKLADNWEIFEKDRGDCSNSVNEQMIKEIRQFEDYVTQNGKRRKEVEELKNQ